MADDEPALVRADWHGHVLSDYLNRLMPIVHATDGFSGAEVHYDANLVVIFGAKQPSPEVDALIAEAPNPIQVEWRDAPYSCAQLTEEAQRLMNSHKSIVGGWPLNNGTGMQFLTTNPALVAATDPTQFLQARYPVAIKYGQAATPAAK